jgi:hypothetical protein
MIPTANRLSEAARIMRPISSQTAKHKIGKRAMPANSEDATPDHKKQQRDVHTGESQGRHDGGHTTVKRAFRRVWKNQPTLFPPAD